ncbi:transient receptor potential cation channel subfamily M member-like 2 [Dreissena polymorpha]|uniref:transient receptor potential cation channel subfamily M member-like 2 n=1 Tax=Dreissena polymorpha TaxID=45954 RepID=UPI0022655051|nr:transient receptor potential cation channel subfamily M member-like 2 [Dreissena polymorpha]
MSTETPPPPPPLSVRYEQEKEKEDSALDDMAKFLKNRILKGGTPADTSLRNVGRLIKKSVNIDQENPYRKAPYSSESTEEVGTPLDQFIFSVLFETSKKAEDALKKCNDKIGAALIASSLLKTVSKLTKREAEFDLSANIMTNSRNYEMKACDYLADYFNKDREHAYSMLTQKLEKPLSSINAWELAYATHLKTFMGQTCCQTKLKIIWRGRMATFTPWWQIVMALFLPFLVTTITFTDTANGDRVYKYSSVKMFTCKRKGGSDIGFLDALNKLYTAPISVFTTNTISYLLFLWLFSYFVLVELEARVTTIEYVLWGWSFTMLCEELRQLVTSQGRTPLKKIWCWYVSNWNKYDLATFLVGMASVVMRLTVKEEDGLFDYVRYLYRQAPCTNLFIRNLCGLNIGLLML